MLARFMREGHSPPHHCVSPHVVQIFDYGVEDGTAFIAMELLQALNHWPKMARRARLAPCRQRR